MIIFLYDDDAYGMQYEPILLIENKINQHQYKIKHHQKSRVQNMREFEWLLSVCEVKVGSDNR